MEVDPAIRSSHLDAIDAALRRHPMPRPSRGRRWTLGVVVAMLLAGPVSAVAGDRAVPGDLLYPFKRAFEPIVALIDRDVVAEHRVGEVGELVRRGSEAAVVEARVAVARDALEEADDPVLERELDRIVDSWSTDRRAADVAVPDRVTPSTTSRDGSPQDPGRQRRTDVPPPITTTSRAEEQVDSVAPPSDRTTTTGTEAPTGDGGRPLQDDPPADRP